MEAKPFQVKARKTVHENETGLPQLKHMLQHFISQNQAPKIQHAICCDTSKQKYSLNNEKIVKIQISMPLVQ